ncbi:MAG: hypothetical protein Tsb0033_17270 [Winogradskyella sp.]
MAVSIKLAIQSKKEKLSIFNTIASVIIGVGCAYLSSGWVLNNFEDTALPIACITIIGEKVGYYLIYKFNFDVLGDSIIEYWIEKYKSKK